MDILIEEQMKYILMPSLQRRALIKTVITVWNQDDVRALAAKIIKSSIIELRGDWQVVEDKVIKKVQVLPLPESLKIRLIGFVKPILLEVLRWRDFHKYLLYDERSITKSLSKMCWTPLGTIDKKKTAEAIIRDEELRIRERYIIACNYCLKNDILMLWNKIPEIQRKGFYSEDHLPGQYPVVLLLTYDVKGEVNRMEYFIRELQCTPYQYALEPAVVDGHQVATEYILQNLTPEEREESVVRCAELLCSRTLSFHCLSYNDVLWFLLSQMNEEHKITVLENYPCGVLKCLLCWPWQGFFMKIAKHVREFISTKHFYFLLKLIIKKVEDGFKDYDYQYLFMKFWQQSPITHKEDVKEICVSLLDLLRIKDKGNIKVILEDLTTQCREKVFFSTCKRLVCNDKIDSLEFFVQECQSTKDITIKFREFVKQKNSMESRVKRKCMWSKISQLLDGLSQKCDNKKCVEDGNSGPAKRFCS